MLEIAPEMACENHQKVFPGHQENTPNSLSFLKQAPDGHIPQVQPLSPTLSLSLFTVRRDLYHGKG